MSHSGASSYLPGNAPEKQDALMILDMARLPAAWVAGRMDALFVSHILHGADTTLTDEQLQARVARLEAIAAAYPGVGTEQTPGGLVLPAPEVIPPEREEILRGMMGMRVADLRWRSAYVETIGGASGYAAAHDAASAARYQENPNLSEITVRWYRLRSRAPRPTVIVVHGYLGGDFRVEERMWPLRLLRALGLDVVLFVMPHHGARSHPERERPIFPGEPVMTLEGIRHTIHDLRVLKEILHRRGVERVGVMGMSLGGFVTALWTTLDPTLDFSIPLIPLASFSDWGRDAGVGSAHDPALTRAYYDAMERATATISPLARPALVDPSRIRIIAGRSDHVTPLHHARKLARHFGVPLMTFPGGHLLQVGRAAVLRDALEPLVRPHAF